MDGREPQTEEKMSHHTSILALCGYGSAVDVQPFAQWFPEFLQDKLKNELSEPGFSQLPYHFAEIAKVLLDV
jgi:hypothetical protein